MPRARALSQPPPAAAPQPMPVAELLVKRRQLIKRMQELEQVGQEGRARLAWHWESNDDVTTAAPPCRQPESAGPSPPILLQAFIAHQLEEEANVLPRLTSTLPGGGWRCCRCCWWHRRCCLCCCRRRLWC